MKEIKKDFKIVGEDIRHQANYFYVETKHYLGLTDDFKYNLEKTTEDTIHLSNMTRIHVNHPMVNNFLGNVNEYIEDGANLLGYIHDIFDS